MNHGWQSEFYSGIGWQFEGVASSALDCCYCSLGGHQSELSISEEQRNICYSVYGIHIALESVKSWQQKPPMSRNPPHTL